MSDEGDKFFRVIVCSKSIRNTLGFVHHFFLQVPHLDMEIHCGEYKNGSHHYIGHTKHFDQLWSMDLCETCMNQLYHESTQLFKFWYYPIVNCETLARGLVSGVSISFQTLIIAGLSITTLALFTNLKWIVIVVVLLLLLVIVNNLYRGSSNQKCMHITTSKK